MYLFASGILWLSLIVVKAIVGISLLNFQKLSTWFWFPGIFVVDTVYASLLLLIYYGIIKRTSKATDWFNLLMIYAFKFAFCVLWVVAISLNSAYVSYFLVSGNLLDWTTAVSFMEDYSSTFNFFFSNSGPALCLFTLHAFLLVLYAIFTRLLRKSKYFLKSNEEPHKYETIFLNDPNELELKPSELFSDSSNLINCKSDHDHITNDETYLQKRNTISLSNEIKGLSISKRLVIKISLPSLALLSFLFFTQPKIPPWPQLKSSVVIDCVLSTMRFSPEYLVGAQDHLNSEKLLDLSWTNSCSTITEMMFSIRTSKFKCSPVGKNITTPEDWKTLRRNKKSVFQNVVFLFLESARGDIVPFNYTSAQAPKLLIPEAIVEKNITPFMEKISKDGLFYNKARTTSSYTIKSILSTICGMYPLLVDTSKEHSLPYYKECLPDILAKSGWESSFWQPSDSGFDHQWTVMEKMKFTKLFTKWHIEQGEIGPPSNFTPVNYFGYPDEIMVNPIMEWVDTQAKNERPFFLSYLTNVSHDPNSTPASWKTQKFSEDEWTNKYLNSIAYCDRFMEKFFEGFIDRGLDKNTLFVVLGDHGMSIHDNNKWGTSENWHEPLYHVPLVFWSNQPHWRSKFPAHMNETPVTALDVFPSVLDLLNDNLWKIDAISNAPRNNYNHEGFSLFQKPYPVENFQFGITNPGFNSLVIKQDYKKFVLLRDGSTFAFDLKSDPTEMNPIYDADATVNEDFKKWINWSQFLAKLFKTKNHSLYGFIKTY